MSEKGNKFREVDKKGKGTKMIKIVTMTMRKMTRIIQNLADPSAGGSVAQIFEHIPSVKRQNARTSRNDKHQQSTRGAEYEGRSSLRPICIKSHSFMLEELEDRLVINRARRPEDDIKAVRWQSWTCDVYRETKLRL